MSISGLPVTYPAGSAPPAAHLRRRRDARARQPAAHGRCLWPHAGTWRGGYHGAARAHATRARGACSAHANAAGGLQAALGGARPARSARGSWSVAPSSPAHEAPTAAAPGAVRPGACSSSLRHEDSRRRAHQKNSC
ncbi:hypothetical protein GUJ93_ZPchr0007g3031 [Zizania palustris]|uniref:Uncharacterized protein n=1 Tax=Zizania palustris TaxID=103762 RepID=A0A8J5W5I7_ZIZPA|nr:hypothetical protein GUJ93_ZPchr0007g3031 [Zizania palustris]